MVGLEEGYVMVGLELCYDWVGFWLWWVGLWWLKLELGYGLVRLGYGGLWFGKVKVMVS